MGIDLTLVPEIRRDGKWEPAVPFKMYPQGPFKDYDSLDQFYSSARYGLLYYLVGFSTYGDLPVADNIHSTPPPDAHPHILFAWDIGTRNYTFWLPLQSLLDYLWDEPYTGDDFIDDYPENKGAPLVKLKLGFHGYTAEHFREVNLPRLQALGPVEDTRVHFFFG